MANRNSMRWSTSCRDRLGVDRVDLAHFDAPSNLGWVRELSHQICGFLKHKTRQELPL
jgi:hypothetical protein